MFDGWIKAFRKMQGWEWYKCSTTFHLFMHLLFRASYRPRMWRGVSLAAGQLVTGRQQLSQETGIPVQSIRTALKRLESSGEITRKSTNKFSVITVCNYSHYQDGGWSDNQQANQSTSRPQSQQPNQAANHIQEVKKGKKKRRKNKGGDDAPPAKKKDDGINNQAKEVLAYLNEKTGKRFTSLGKIPARIKEGRTVDECKQVIDIKFADKDFPRKYLDHTTPFRPDNFDKYLNQTPGQGAPGNGGLTYDNSTIANDQGWGDPGRNRWVSQPTEWQPNPDNKWAVQARSMEAENEKGES